MTVHHIRIKITLMYLKQVPYGQRTFVHVVQTRFLGYSEHFQVFFKQYYHFKCKRSAQYLCILCNITEM